MIQQFNEYMHRRRGSNQNIGDLVQEQKPGGGSSLPKARRGGQWKRERKLESSQKDACDGLDKYERYSMMSPRNESVNRQIDPSTITFSSSKFPISKQNHPSNCLPETGKEETKTKSSREISALKFQNQNVSTPRSHSRRKIDPVVEKTSILKQRIDKIFHMTPKKAKFICEEAGVDMEICKKSSQCNVYQTQNPKQTQDRLHQCSNQNLVKQVSDPQLRGTKLSQQFPSMQLNDMCRKIGFRLQAIIERHG